MQVMFGGGAHSALGVALLRTGGIVLGVLLLMSLTVIILPKSATIEALRCAMLHCIPYCCGVLCCGSDVQGI